jgi:hypothetical protein
MEYSQMTKETIVNDLLSAGFELDGHSDYRRVSQFVLDEYKLRASNKAVWAIINELKNGDVQELDFD